MVNAKKKKRLTGQTLANFINQSTPKSSEVKTHGHQIHRTTIFQANKGLNPKDSNS